MTRRLVLCQVDVFAERMLTGNAAMVVFGGVKLNDQEMQAVARETNLSETVFVLHAVEGADYRIRTFTTRREIPFSGHPSLAAAHAYSSMHSADSLRLVQEDGRGLTTICRDGPEGDWFLKLPQPTISPIRVPIGPEIGALFATDDRLLGAGTWQLASTGVPWLVIEVRDRLILRSLRPDHARIASWSLSNKAVGVTVYARVGRTGVDAELRAFAPAEGIYEDPVCGSCAGAVAAILRREEGDLADPRDYIFVQGESVNRPGRMTVREDSDGAFYLGGSTITSVTGVLRI